MDGTLVCEKHVDDHRAGRIELDPGALEPEARRERNATDGMQHDIRLDGIAFDNVARKCAAFRFS